MPALCGYIADQLETRRLPLLCGLVTLGGATVLLQLGTSITVLIIGRVLQGLSAAIVWVVCLALLSDTVGSKAIGEAMGWVSTSMSAAILLAPILGGVVLEKAGYSAVFAMAYGLLGLDIVLRLAIIERSVAAKYEAPRRPMSMTVTRESWLVPPRSPPPHPADEKISLATALRIDTSQLITAFPKPPGSVEYGPLTSSSSPLSTTSPFSAVPPFSPTSPTSIDCPKLQPLQRSRLPPIITLLASRRLLSALWGVMVQAALLTAFDSTVPLYVHEIFGWDSVGAGLIFLPLLLPSMLGPLIGRLVDRFGSRWFATAAFLFAAPFLVLLRFVHYNSMGQKVLLCGLFVLLGLCLNLMVGPLMAEIAWIVEDKEAQRPGLFGEKGAYAQAYGLFNMAFAAGCLIGPLWGGMVREHAGWGTMTWTLAVVSGISAIPTALWCGGWLVRGGSAIVEITDVESKGREQGGT
ncbi:MAG: MFS transporter [Terriglobus roseus]|nr:MFS transporter [Terriglobus roseus]